MEPHLDRPSKQKIEHDVRAALASHGVPCMMPVHDGPPVFDANHEELIAYYVADLDRLWARAVEVFKQLKQTARPRLTPEGIELRFDFSDVQAATLAAAPGFPEACSRCGRTIDDYTINWCAPRIALCVGCASIVMHGGGE